MTTQAMTVAQTVNSDKTGILEQAEPERDNGTDKIPLDQRAEVVYVLHDTVSASAKAEGRSSDVPIAQVQAEAKAQFEQTKAQLSSLSAKELEIYAQTELASDDVARMSELLICQAECALTEQEHSELNILHEKMMAMTTTRAAALWLLQNRHGLIGNAEGGKTRQHQ